MDKIKQEGIRSAGSFTIEERKEIIKDFLTGTHTKVQIWQKYTGQNEEHGNLNRWMKQLGMQPVVRSMYRLGKKSAILGNQSLTTSVSKKEKKDNPEELKKRIKDLEQQLETANLKAEGYEIMIDIAEKELNIPIRKKSDTK